MAAFGILNHPATEPVLIQRTGAVLGGLVDPQQHQLILDYGVDVVAGDVAGFRGYTRRITGLPELWSGAGIVATFEDGSVLLPDLGQIKRASGPAVLDEDTGIRAPATLTTLWTGACLVEPAQSDGSNPEIGDQQVGVVPFVVTIPLTVTDIKPGDLFTVTQSRDARLLIRTLVVKAVRASSTDTTRTLLAFDNQGG